MAAACGTPVVRFSTVPVTAAESGRASRRRRALAARRGARTRACRVGTRADAGCCGAKTRRDKSPRGTHECVRHGSSRDCWLMRWAAFIGLPHSPQNFNSFSNLAPQDGHTRPVDFGLTGAAGGALGLLEGGSWPSQRRRGRLPPERRPAPFGGLLGVLIIFRKACPGDIRIASREGFRKWRPSARPGERREKPAPAGRSCGLTPRTYAMTAIATTHAIR